MRPIIIPDEERAGIAAQWERFARMTPERRVAIGLAWSQVALDARRDRIRRQHPQAGPDEMKRLQRIEILGYDPDAA